MTGLKAQRNEASESLRSAGTVLKEQWLEISILIHTVVKSLETFERGACTCFACSGKIEKSCNYAYSRLKTV